jgi:ribosome-associated protein
MRIVTLNEAETLPKPDGLRLDRFLKMNAIAQTGGQAKLLIQGGEVKVNGEVETRRRRKLVAGDVVEVSGRPWRIEDSF